MGFPGAGSSFATIEMKNFIYMGKTMKNFGFLILVIAIAGLSACAKKPETYSTGRVDSFVVDSEDLYTQSNKILQADYMFVVDVSASMGFNSGDLLNPW